MGNDSNILMEGIGIILVILILLILIFRFFLRVYAPFSEERDYIKMEIARSYGNSRIHWQHELHRLYLSLIPFIGRKLAEANRNKESARRK